MTTENIYPENRDVDTSVVEHSSVSETEDNLQEPPTQAVSDVTGPADQKTEGEPTAASIPQEQKGPTTQAVSDVTVPTNQETQGEPSTPAETSHEGQEASVQSTETQVPATETSVEQPLESQLSQEQEEKPASADIPLVQEEIVRPFTDFIEEFRLSEGHQSGSLEAESVSSLIASDVDAQFIAPLPPPSPDTQFELAQQASETIETANAIEVLEDAQLPASTVEMGTQEVEQALPPEQVVVDTAQEQSPVQTTRPVSPLLRPPSPRGRSSRHGGHRHREEQNAAQVAKEASSPAQEPAKPEHPAAVEPSTAPTPVEKPVETAPVEEPPRPPRRYRFDRKTPSTRTEENKETLNRMETSGGRLTVPPTHTDNGHEAQSLQIENRSAQQSRQAAGTPQTPEQPATKQPIVQEPVSTEGEVNGNASVTTTPSIQERYQGQNRPQTKEQPTNVTETVPPSVEPTTEVTTSVAEPLSSSAGEVAPEDLPPLEYSELQAASSRRRRRKRTGNAGTATSAVTTSSATKSATSEPVLPSTASSPSPMGGTAPMAGASPATTSNKNAATSQPNQYNIVSGYTVNQMNQGNDVSGPFMGPDPSPARGSTIHSNVRHIRPESQRSHVYPVRPNESGISAGAMNQFVNSVTQALQTQTDRMVAELRRANQAPANISVTLPPFPSTERVGVFVDVANLLYSARTLRMTIDFGKLLDFLRGNRRLIRAHAYCPTSPQPGDEQMFLQAVKGLGYRITTKNYKTFSSGAKKADLDLDLCMDVVRLVDGKAVDCIVLVSGDSDFMPLLDYCADHGVRVEVAAFDEAMSATLRQSCDLFINLSMLDEIRA